MVAKVLIAIDLSDSAKTVLKSGKGLASKYQAEYQLIHCIEPHVKNAGEFNSGQVMLDLIEIKKELWPQLQMLAKKFDIDNQHINLEFGTAAEAIINKAKNEHYDLIVIGSHSHHGPKLVLGSTCTNVLHHAHCDVLAIRIQSNS